MTLKGDKYDIFWRVMLLKSESTNPRAWLGWISSIPSSMTLKGDIYDPCTLVNVSLTECWCDDAAGIEKNSTSQILHKNDYSTKLFIASSSTHQSHMACALPYITPVTWLTISQHPSPTTPPPAVLQESFEPTNGRLQGEFHIFCFARKYFYTACCQLK